MMAQAVVSIALQTVNDLLVNEVKFLGGVRGRVEEIKTEILMMQAFLVDVDARKLDVDERIHNWISQVREAVYNIEDIILQYVAMGRSSRRRRISRNLLSRFTCFLKDLITTHKLGNEAIMIKSKLVELARSLQAYGVSAAIEAEITENYRSGGPGYLSELVLRRTYSHVLEDDFVGMEDAINLLVGHLVDERTDQMIPICGMGGSGKTTIVRKLYNHKDVRRNFDSFAWTCISQQWDRKDVLQGILIKLIPEERDKVIGMREEELIKQIHNVQLQKKCLVVLDDVWSIQDWQRLRDAFPNRKKTKSKVLITTRQRELAIHVNGGGFAYEPRSLSKEESWELLRKKAFHPSYDDEDHEPEVDMDLEKFGRLIVKRCSGLPLAIVVLGGILVTRPTLREWEIVHQNINWFLSRGKGGLQRQDQSATVTEVLAFSYQDLPYKFKRCFLYLSNFPEDMLIPAEKLYQLWLAEGIISPEDRAEKETMMDVAERYLGELAQRCLVQVEVKETAGCFKSCHLHDLMRDLCLSMAREENFSWVLDYRDGESPRINSSSLRRVSIYLDLDFKYFSQLSIDTNTNQKSSCIRSVFLYSNGCKEVVWQRIKSTFSNYNLLRVLDLQGLRCAETFPQEICKLIHLRYLSIRHSQFKTLPSSLGRLLQLQTLDLEVLGDVSLEIPNVFWKMKSLSHLYLPANFHVGDGKKLRLHCLIALETLINFDTCTCDVNDLQGLTSLRKLRAIVREKLEDLSTIMTYLDSKKNQLRRFSLSIRSHEFSLDEEFSPVTQILGCHRLYKLFIQGTIVGKLPEHHLFSPSIAKLALKASELKEDPMATLEILPKLSSLTLYDSAFSGEKMSCSAKGFPQLKYLKLWGLHELKRWDMGTPNVMPKLLRLVIAHCDKLEMLPDGLQYIYSLQKLNIRRMPKVFKNRLTAIDGNKGEDFYKVQHVRDIKID